MKKVKTHYNRRSFLKISAAAGGGILIGFNWLAACTTAKTSEQIAGVPDEWFDINGYIKIGNTGLVTIFSPNPEIGQNVKTSMPMIVAEELDVDWKNVVVEQAPLNTGVYQNQFAGGSLSIRLSWNALRMAGATGKRMLLEAAAKEWSVTIDDIIAVNGTIKEKTGQKRSIGYGGIASKAVGIEVPEEVNLKEIKNFKLIGTNVKNVEAKNIVTGKPLFGLDFYRDNMQMAMIVHPPAFGMTVESFNENEIKKMDGINDAFIIDTTVKNKKWGEVNAFPKLITIVGKTTWQIIQAKRAVKAKWKTVEKLEDSKSHLIKMETTLANGKVKVKGVRKDGNTDKAFKKAAKIIERTYSAPFMAHNTMEPMNFFANVTNDTAELIGPTQTPEALEKSVATFLNLPLDNVTVNMTRIGGGFGRRLYTHFGLEAAVISKKINAPVKLIYTREDDMSQGTYRPAYLSTYKAGLDENNNLIAFSIKGTSLGGSGAVFPNRFPAGSVKNYTAENLRSATNITTGAWRAPKSHFTAAAEQSFLDEVAELAEKDPIDFRLELFKNAIINPIGKKHQYDAERYAGVLKLVKEKSNWGKETPGVYRGVSAYFCHFSYVAEVVDVVLENNQPKIKKVWCAVDCGVVVNPDAAKNMIQGGVVDGIGHSMYSQLTFTDGVPNQRNFDKYQMIRHSQAPKDIEVFFVDNEIAPTGLGEPGLPPVAGALANALYKMTGKRHYQQPFMKNETILG